MSGLDRQHNLDDVSVATYEELRRLASAVKGRDRSTTLNPTALVNEAWLKLAGSPGVTTTSHLHLERTVTRAMREVLIEVARPRQAMMVESRFLGVLEIPEIAELLQVSEATAVRDWRAAGAWLGHELRGR
jgi:hypothetical protein